MATIDAYLGLLGLNFNIIKLVLGMLLFITGVVVFFKHRHVLRFMNTVAGAYFLGSFTFSLGMVSIVYSGPRDPVMAVQATFYTSIGLGVVGAVGGFSMLLIGDIMLGCASGWSMWSLFAGLLPSPIGNLILGISVALAGGVAIKMRPDKAPVFIRSWFGSALLTIGLGSLIINAIIIRGVSGSIVTITSFTIYISTIIITFILFAIHLKRSQLSSDNDLEMGNEKSNYY